jgi:hypothetical protein
VYVCAYGHENHTAGLCLLCRNDTVADGEVPPAAKYGPTGPAHVANDALEYGADGTLRPPKRDSKHLLRALGGGLLPKLILVLVGVFAIAMVVFLIDLGSQPNEPSVGPRVVEAP